ncbi:carcinoembryonic antigen-related cell adhesion molecule 5-like isoform X2 [Epinephelus moara]|uniref:carcinoembryonic antigen-related cell adhesion molecule 5-like isoform X2 n=1 Tax=Epinephelus moara TaxID=300413 RepID=UPI00214DF873|nr:carcinoembryonic antigen-related cell adhesion molecule 5-like isoform X2 [Epinephelus moara]
MDILPLLCIVSAAFTGLSKGVGVLPDVLNAAVGETVMFTTTLTPPEKPFSSVGWTFDGKNIITFNDKNFTAPEYEGRITLFMSTGSLELRNVALNDSGVYRVTIFPSGEQQKTVPVSNVTATASSTDLVEFNSSVRLSCSASGTSLSFLWLNGSSEVTEGDRVQLTDGGANLTILDVTRYDQGPFRCHVSNPVSDGTSDPITFNISYGPDNVTLTMSPSKEFHAEGSNIDLMCSADSKPAAQFKWLLNGSLLSNTGLELRLTNIQMNHSGNYSCQAHNSKTLRYESSPPATISVLTRVASVVITSDPPDLVEFNSSVRLSCSSSGSSLSFLWLNGSSEVTESDRVQLTDGGANLTILNVTRYDQGPFRCHVFNPVSNGTSDPLNLSISYGPDNINVTISPSQEYYGEGSDISLMCSAVSRPPALFHWFLNGDLLSDTGPELRLMNIQMNHSGNYSCQAFNNKTLRYQTSQRSVVSVLEIISGASITLSTTLPIEGNSVNLTCDAAGSVFTRKWMKDGSDLILSDNIILYDKNRVLSFKSLTKKDSGEYSCTVSNPVSSDEAKYSMEVNYGPENVQITGPSEINPNENLTLTCSAESRPLANYTWILNGTEIHNSAVFTKDNIQPSDSGIYTCEAMNDVTGRKLSANHELSVTVKPQHKGGCRGGCIAGIVIAVLVVLAAAGGGGYFFYRKKIQKKNTTSRTGFKGGEGQENTGFSGGEGQENTRFSGGEGQENTGFSGSSKELHYVEVKFDKNKGGAVQPGPQNDTSEYVELQVNKSRPKPSSPPSYDDHWERQKGTAPQPPNATQVPSSGSRESSRTGSESSS